MTAIANQNQAALALVDESVEPLKRSYGQLREISTDAANVVEQIRNPAIPDTRDLPEETDIARSPLLRTGTNYVCLALVLTVVGLTVVWVSNKRFAPLIYDRSAIQQVADAFIDGKNFAVFDLNIDIRNLRNEHIARLPEAPEVAILGASHWQEANVDLLPSYNLYNSHVHRDYYEDMLAMTEMYIRHGKLPKTMIITIRDDLFKPVADRTDYLWLPGIEYYRVMALRLRLQPHSKLATIPVQSWREQLSFNFLRDNILRELQAPVAPHATKDQRFRTLDTLLPGGSILWSGEHLETFTAESARNKALEFAMQRRNDPPRIDPEGVKAIDALLAFLRDRSVKVYLAHPPFNPIFRDAVAGSPYARGLKDIERITRDYAEKYQIPIIGGFDAEKVGCSAEMYIDAEHAGPECLANILNEFAELDQTATSPGNVRIQ